MGSGGLSFAQPEKSIATNPLMSAIVKRGPQTDSSQTSRDFRFVPIADMQGHARSTIL
jgi:hypothetical protein